MLCGSVQQLQPTRSAGDYQAISYLSNVRRVSLFTKQINGKLTLGENIADNGGIHTAFRAYQDMSLNTSLPIKHLTNDQIFFVSFSQVSKPH